MAIKGYWRLNGNSNDASGNGNNGTDTAISYGHSSGKLNQGASFNGSTSFISVVTDPVVANLSYTGWIKTSVDILQSIKAGSNYPDQLNGIPEFRISSRYLQFLSSTTALIGQSSQQITLDKWNHVAITYSSSGVYTFYLNGVACGTGTALYTLRQNTMYIGKMINEINVSNSFFNGAIDEFVIHDTVISPAKIKNDYSKAVGFF